MSTRADRWREARARALARRPWLRLDRVRVTERAKGAGWEVVIEGMHLHPVVSPPAVTVGGVAAERLTFAPDGRTLRAVLTRRPSSLHVVVDYGFVRAELRA
ncbi:MAG: hypothetical protein FJ027_14025 [Candidatus Rokubacteria bacterium]|nr:hypothetical protein [Candidatus Rokubacteria bacterium]